MPTGGGKTLAGMRFALRHVQLYGKKRIIFVIPYTSIVEQNAKEIRDIFGRDEAILENHSNALPEGIAGEDYVLDDSALYAIAGIHIEKYVDGALVEEE